MLNIKIDQLQKYIESLIKKELDNTQTFDTFFTGKILSISNGNHRIQLDNASQDLINAYPLNDKMFSKDDYVYVVKITNALNSNYAILDKVRDLQEEFINLPLADRFKEKETTTVVSDELDGDRLVGKTAGESDFIKVIKNNGTFKIKAVFTTGSQAEKIQGGLKISLGNKLKIDMNEEGKPIEVYDPEGTLKTYFLTEDDLIGQPENMSNLPQEKVFLIEDKNICELFQYIYFEKIGDMDSFICKNIDLISGSLLDVDAVIQIKTRFENDKDYFAKDDITTYDNSVKVIADFYYDGQLLDLEGQIQYYWLIKDKNTTSNSDSEKDSGYLSLAGNGWKCLNEFEKVNFIENSSSTYKSLKKWKNEDKFINLNIEGKEDFLEYENILKCLVRFGDNIISSKEFIVYNYKQEQFFAEIVYPGSPVLLFNQENLSLTCNITNGSSRIQLSNYNISYSWSRSADGESWNSIKIDKEKILDTKTIFIYDREELGEIPENTESYQYVQMSPGLELEYFRCEAIIRTLNGDYVSTEYGIQEIISKVDLETEINVRVQYKYFISKYTDLNFQKSKSGDDWNIYLPDGTQGEWVEGEKISEDTVFSDMSIFNDQAELEKGLYVYFTKKAFWYETKEGEDNILREDAWDFPLIARQVGYVEGELVNIKEGYSIEQLNTFNKLTSGGEKQGVYYADIGTEVLYSETPDPNTSYYIRNNIVGSDDFEYIPITLNIKWLFKEGEEYYIKKAEDLYELVAFTVDNRVVDNNVDYYEQLIEKNEDGTNSIRYILLKKNTGNFDVESVNWPEGATGPFYKDVKERVLINADYINTGTLRVGDVDNEIFYANLRGDEKNPVKIAGYYVSNTDLVSQDNIVGISSDTDKNAFWAGSKVEVIEDDKIIEKNKFQVTHNGDLFAQNANITGTIFANNGRIGQWEINEGKIGIDKLSDLSSNLGIIEAGTIQSPNYGTISEPSNQSQVGSALMYSHIPNAGWAVYSIQEEVAELDQKNIVIPSYYYSSLDSYDEDIVYAISRLTFQDNINIVNLYINENLQDIGERAFKNCSNLTEITLPSTLLTIGLNAFLNCDKIKKVFFRGNAEQWSKIRIGSGNEQLFAAQFYFFDEDKETWTKSGFKISCEGAKLIESPYFLVSQLGTLVAQNATIQGNIQASSGTFGNCTINTDGSIVSANGRFTVDADGDLIAQNAEIQGNIEASKGTIGAMKIEDGRISAGSKSLTLDVNNGDIIAQNIQVKTCTVDEIKNENHSIILNYGMTESEEIVFKISEQGTIIDEGDLNFWGTKIENSGSVEYTITTQNGEILSKKVVLTIGIPYIKRGDVSNYIYDYVNVILEPNTSTINFSVDYYIMHNNSIYFCQVYLSDRQATIEPPSIKQATSSTNSKIMIKGNIIGPPMFSGATMSENWLGDTNCLWGGVFATGGYFTHLSSEEANFTELYYSSSGINDSDKNKKNTINILSIDYGLLFDKLRPVTFKYNNGTSGRLHVGFIAQEVRDSVLLSGLTTQDFAGYCEWTADDGSSTCGLRYEEFIALCVDQIQKLKKRVIELENKINNI